MIETVGHEAARTLVGFGCALLAIGVAVGALVTFVPVRAL